MNAAPQFEPLPYHRAVVEHLTEYEPGIWRWAFSQETRGEQVREMQALLLRQTYRLDPEAYPEIYEDCRAVLTTLAIEAPVTIYQAPDGMMNAALWYVPGEMVSRKHGGWHGSLASDDCWRGYRNRFHIWWGISRAFEEA